MERMMGVFKPKPKPQEQLRDWQRRLRQEAREIDRQVRDIQREEKNVQKAIRDALKRNDTGSAKSLAKELVKSRRTVNRLYENRARLNSISMHLGETVALAKVVGHIGKSVELMKLMNGMMKAPEMAVRMQDFEREMLKNGIIEETVAEQLDLVMDSEDMEEEVEEEVDKVLSELAVETVAQMPATVRREKMKQPVQHEEAAEHQAVAEGVDDDDAELEALRARLADVRS